MLDRLNLGVYFNSVARRISLLFLLAASIPSVMLAILVYSSVSELAQEQQHNKLVDASQAYAMKIFERLSLAEDILKRQTVNGISNEKLRFKEIVYGNTIFRSLRSVKKDELALDGLETPVTVSDLSSESKAPSLDGQVKTAIYLFRKPGSVEEHAVALAVPISSDGRVEQILLAELMPDFLWGERENISEEMNICVFSNRNQQLFCVYPKESPGNPQLAIAKGAGTKNLFLKGRFNADTWIVIASARSFNNSSDWAQLFDSFAMVAMTSVLLVILLSLIQIRRTMGPLKALIGGTRKIAHGDYSPVSVEANNEFRELTDAVNVMAGRISRQINTLQALSLIDREMSERLDMTTVFDRVAERIHHLIPGVSVCLTLLAEDPGEDSHWRISHASGQETRIWRAPILPENLATIAVQTSGVWLKSGFLSETLGSLMPERTIAACWCLPVFWQGKMLGFIVLGCADMPGVAEEVLDEIRELASRLAIAVTSQMREERLQYQARFDSLTGLPNRFTLFETLGTQLSPRDSPDLTAVLFIDIDRFKFFNDTLGHGAGDQLLSLVGSRLSQFAAGNGLVARIGGDEFVMMFDRCRNEEAIKTIVERLMDEMARPFNVEGNDYAITCSIGIAQYPLDAENGEALVELADMAMFRAKERGRNNYQFYVHEMSVRTHERLLLDSELRHALDRNELFLEYQPKVDLHGGKIVGLEALIRWRHPELGIISPNRFIPIAEDIGLIVPIGEWVLRTACRQNKAWHDAGFDTLRVAVNLSAHQFTQQGLVETIERIIRETGVEPRHVELELTESIIMADADRAATILEQLHGLGVILSIDDFGTGYSSLAYLKRFPVHILKIDRSFVMDISDNDDSIVIVKSIISLAHNLKLKVIAEGVETREQLERLAENGCDQMQGYYFSRPVGVAEIIEMLQEDRRLTVLPVERA